MELNHLLMLVGLIFEIFGAFILAVDAIGLERFDGWIAQLRGLRAEIAGEKKRGGSTFSDPRRFIAGIASAAGSVAGFTVFHYFPLWTAQFSNTATHFAAALIGSVFAAVLGVFLTWAILMSLHMLSTFLQKLRNRAEIHAVGLLGFGLLFAGFVFQFSGTLGDMLIKR